MRIKQNKLTGKKPVKHYVRYINGVHAIVLIYDNPRCVNTIITGKDGRIIRQCYPLTEEQYDIYMEDNPTKQMEMIAKGGKIYK